MKIELTAYDLALRFIGVRETAGTLDNPQVMAMLKLDGDWPQHDEVPWCSAFVNYVAWLLRLPRSKSLAARSWLEVGKPVPVHEAEIGFDVVVLSRDGAPEAGHVGFFAGAESGTVYVLGGNQGNAVSLAKFPAVRMLGIRRLV